MASRAVYPSVGTPVIHLYRRILRAAAVFPSSKRDKIILVSCPEERHWTAPSSD